MNKLIFASLFSMVASSSAFGFCTIKTTLKNTSNYTFFYRINGQYKSLPGKTINRHAEKVSDTKQCTYNRNKIIYNWKRTKSVQPKATLDAINGRTYEVRLTTSGNWDLVIK